MNRTMTQVVIAILAIITLVAPGCGGRGSGGVTQNYTGEIVTGTVSAPAGVGAARSASATTASVAIPGASIEVYYIDSESNKTGSTIAATTADANGNYSVELPYGTALPAPGLVAASGTGDNLMRAFVTDNSVNVSLFSENAVYNLLQEGRDFSEITSGDMAYFEYMGERDFESSGGVSGTTTVAEQIQNMNMPMPMGYFWEAPCYAGRADYEARGTPEENLAYILHAISQSWTVSCRLCCLKDADLSGRDLQGADLTDAFLAGANLSGTNMSGARLSTDFLSSVSLENANLSNAYMYMARINGGNLKNANFRNVNFKKGAINNSDASNADMSGADLSDTWITETNFRNANLSNVKLDGASIWISDMSGANVDGVSTDAYTLFVDTTWADGSMLNTY